MSCGACVRKVAMALNALPDTRAEEVRVGAARVRTTLPASEIERALGEAGFPARAE